MKQFRKKYVGITIIVSIIIIVFLAIFLKKEDKNEKNTVDIALGDDLSVIKVGPYSGSYMEDGSDENVENVLSIMITNNGTRTLQYAEAEFTYGDKTAVFTFSTLRPGQSMLVLEKNHLDYFESYTLTDAILNHEVFFQRSLNICEDKFRITAADGVFNVENISGDNLTGNISIYYKNKKDDIYYGGITYRAIIEGGIEKDGVKQITTKHFTVDGSEVVFVDYTEVN